MRRMLNVAGLALALALASVVPSAAQSPRSEPRTAEPAPPPPREAPRAVMTSGPAPKAYAAPSHQTVLTEQQKRCRERVGCALTGPCDRCP